MSATDELRRLLDERGMEYTQTIVTEGVLFTVATSEEHYFILMRDNDAGIEMWSQYFTPEQAIAATLGPCNDSSNCTNDCTNSERMDLDAATLGRGRATLPTTGRGATHTFAAHAVRRLTQTSTTASSTTAPTADGESRWTMAERIIDLPTEKMATDLRFWLHERIVRCRDCKRVTIDQGDHDYREPLWCGLFHIDVSLDGFCKWGVRRTDG